MESESKKVDDKKTDNKKVVPVPLSFPKLLDTQRIQIEHAVPKGLDPDHFIRIARTEFRLNPKLQYCDPLSVFAAVLQACQLGLKVGGFLGESYLVPRGNECVFWPGYQGLMKLARQSGEVQHIHADIVREGDIFDPQRGLTKHLIHKIPKRINAKGQERDISEADRGEIEYAYAVATFKDFSNTYESMEIAEIEKIRDSSASYKAYLSKGISTPWVTHPIAMILKTAIKRLCKYLPRSPELDLALRLDDCANQTGRQGLTVDNVTSMNWQPPIELIDESIESDINNDFNTLAQNKDPELLGSFLVLMSTLNKCSIEDFKQNAIQNRDQFERAFSDFKISNS